ncbi:uncharacterized protein K452DRAFT_325139 [Aplosporella prunicola CBS 121167]|uniref:PDZ GRASP-type domain-containing protein n=1 Tax=Aplosporella prunicola CBS 121167 TaxID=1176127 RepID=A0A6A6BMX0_9PEZI|nr:uncharacterized protein K452DRAFT_325139 [Aplosporella prunicola CBS 121167]KAF2144605.1 hypothetical protein K452DRAFT_325139 [Aplosporella prunicola CBS 121167]
MSRSDGSLNKFISRLDAAPPQEEEQGLGGAHGFQILRNTNLELAIEPWFDFIIGINGRTIDNPDPALFATEVRNCAGTTISLGIWSAKGHRIRELYVPIPAENPSLGLSLQWTPLAVTEDVWHILDVQPNSPADLAGLLPYGDYVIGSPEGLVRGESGLGELIEDYLNRPLRLFVYNHEYNITRPITITPSRNWGGTGALGCILGFGALHRLPPPLDEPPAGPGETLFEASSMAAAPPATMAATAVSPSSTNFFVPANMPTPPPPQHTPGAAGVPPPPTASTAAAVAPVAHKPRKTRAHHALAPSAGIDEYFKEGEQKSRELDYGAGGGSRPGSIPPPPKAGPPPRGGPPRAGTPQAAPVQAAAEVAE